MRDNSTEGNRDQESTIKEKIWKFVVAVYGCLPSACRSILCRLSFAAAEKRKPESGLRELLFLHERLMFYIDQAAICYEKGIHPKHRLMDYRRFFVGRLEKGEKALDIGCGIGAVAYSMAKAGAVVTGVDVDGENIRRARERYQHENLTFITGDVTKDLPDGDFDAIVMSNVLEHIDDRIGLLMTIRNKFHPKRWLIRVPMINRGWLVPLKRELDLPYFSDPTHHIEYTAESFEKEMAEAGLSIRYSEVIWGEIWAEAR